MWIGCWNPRGEHHSVTQDVLGCVPCKTLVNKIKVMMVIVCDESAVVSAQLLQETVQLTELIPPPSAGMHLELTSVPSSQLLTLHYM